MWVVKFLKLTRRIYMSHAISFKQEVQSFINSHKVLCGATLGLAIVGFSIGKGIGMLAGRSVKRHSESKGSTEMTGMAAGNVFKNTVKNTPTTPSGSAKVATPQHPQTPLQLNEPEAPSGIVTSADTIETSTSIESIDIRGKLNEVMEGRKGKGKAMGYKITENSNNSNFVQLKFFYATEGERTEAIKNLNRGLVLVGKDKEIGDAEWQCPKEPVEGKYELTLGSTQTSLVMRYPNTKDHFETSMEALKKFGGKDNQERLQAAQIAKKLSAFEFTGQQYTRNASNVHKNLAEAFDAYAKTGSLTAIVDNKTKALSEDASTSKVTVREAFSIALGKGHGQLQNTLKSIEADVSKNKNLQNKPLLEVGVEATAFIKMILKEHPSFT
jgi:hypothetical protein